jgi:hypothetical protein
MLFDTLGLDGSGISIGVDGGADSGKTDDPPDHSGFGFAAVALVISSLGAAGVLIPIGPWDCGDRPAAIDATLAPICWSRPRSAWNRAHGEWFGTEDMNEESWSASLRLAPPEYIWPVGL